MKPPEQIVTCTEAAIENRTGRVQDKQEEVIWFMHSLMVRSK